MSINKTAFTEAWRQLRIRCCATPIDDKNPPKRIVMLNEADFLHGVMAYESAKPSTLITGGEIVG